MVRIYNESVSKHIPSTTKLFAAKKALWVTPKVLEAVERKRVTWCKYIASGRDTHNELRKEHKSACKEVARVVKQAVNEYETNLAAQSKSDPKQLHSYVRSK